MAQSTERGTLNHLIEICRDGEKGFATAAGQVTEPTLRQLFLDVAAQRKAFAEELLPHAHRLGGAAESDGSGAARLHRGWMNLKGVLSGHDALTIVTEAERGEDAAVEAYTDALNGVLSPETRDVVERQRDRIQASRDRIYQIDKSRLGAL